ncbi:MAG: hypothetical protein Q8R28_13265, partial [Dehalococcoidia bacterium]|nr:hypothetical protein [Dehalococcoidia bacterium]
MLKARIGIEIVAVLGMVALFMACTPAAVPTPTPAPKAAATAPSAPATAAAPAVAPSVAAATSSKPTALEQLIEAARKEGVVRANLSSSLGQKGAQRLIDALNKKYSLNLKVEYTPAAKMSAVVAQVMTELQTGGVPSWDVVMGTSTHFVEMEKRGQMSSFDWTETFPHIPQAAVMSGGRLLSHAVSFQLPAYNPNLVKVEDVPRKWE